MTSQPVDPRHFLRILDLAPEQAAALLDVALRLKRGEMVSDVLKARIVALIFEKPSTRTRVSFEVAVRQLQGQTLFMTPAESQLGRNEPLKDTARVMSRYVDCLVVRTFGQNVVQELADYGSIPVVNALTDMYHPCQVMSDVLTMVERTPNLDGVKVAWIGDGNNMANSWISAAAIFPFELTLACPEGYDPDPDVIREAAGKGARVRLTRSPEEAVAGARFVNTDVWASMGHEKEQREREAAFTSYQVNGALMAKALPGAQVMHCLPAHRGEEISEDVMEGPASILWDQAENRLHMQKAILHWLFS